MIVDCHGHYTTVPQALWDWRKRQVSEKSVSEKELRIGDDEIRDSLEKAQLKLQRERGSDVTFFSPRSIMPTRRRCSSPSMRPSRRRTARRLSPR